MHTRHGSALLALVTACLFFAGCDDSSSPLSNPEKSKPDARLAGIWRLRNDDGDVIYYHMGRPGEKLPGSMLRVVGVKHTKNGNLEQGGELLIFPTTLGTGTYLNVADGSEQQIKLLEEKGRRPELFTNFFLPKYKIEGDRLLLWFMDGDAKRQAIESGKIKGLIRKEKSTTTVRFTDTTENLARFVASAGDSLFSKEPIRLERVK